MNKTARASVQGYLVRAALFHVPLAQRAELLHVSGIDPAVLDEVHLRVPAEAVTRLWRALNEALDDEFFAFDSKGLPRGAFAHICRSALHEREVDRALQQYVSALNLFLCDFTAHLQARGAERVIRLECRIADPELNACAQEIYLSMLMGFVCWMAGRQVPISRSRFAYPMLGASVDPALWGSNVEHDAPHTEIVFASAQLRRPVVRDFACLKQFLRRAPHDLVVRFRERSGLAAEVYQRLNAISALTWPTQRQMAHELGVSESAFRRRLEREGVSFQGIKHDVRKSMALEALRDQRLSIAEAAARCGFQEASAFHRAFRQWLGVSPGRFRSQHVEAIEPAHEVD